MSRESYQTVTLAAMFGSHLSIAGGLTNALDEAETLKLDCVQIFTRNQRQWRVKPLAPDEISQWHTRLKQLDWHRVRGPARVVSHNSYLINLASPDRAMRSKSINAQRAELERCEQLGIRFSVTHPGAHLSEPRDPRDPNRLDGKPSPAEREGLKRIADSLDQIHNDLPGYRVITCLETTVGSGTNLGYDFHHLAMIREMTAEPDRIGYCFDTCHVTAAGYDMTTPSKAKSVIREFGRICDLKALHAFHFNDSVGAIGSRKDRHAHIGHGTCGLACFETIVNRRGFARVPMILETPKGEDDRGRPWDTVNIRCLKRLMRPRA